MDNNRISTADLQPLVKFLETSVITVADVLASVKKIDEIVLNIDYSRSLRKMIKAGNYNSVDDYITEENFPLPRKNEKKQMSSRIFYFDQRSISIEDVIAEMDKLDYRPAFSEEILALGADKDHPLLDSLLSVFPPLSPEPSLSYRRFLILAPGAISRSDKRRMLTFSSINGERSLSASVIRYNVQYENYAFLGVRK